MGYSKHTTGLVLTPQRKEVSPQVAELFLIRVQQGNTLSAAARSLSLSQSQLKQIIKKIIPDSDLKEAMRIGAEVLVDEASEALKNAADKEEIDKAKALAQHYRWLASKLNKALYGDAVKVDGNIAPSYSFLLNIAAPNTSAITDANGKNRPVIEHRK